MARLTFQDVEHTAQRGRPWTIRLEMHGANPAVAGGWSSKYWYATGRGLHEAVETGWGAVGAKPQHALITWAEFRDKVDEKLGKGYDYVSTPYIRMTPESLAKLTGTPVQAAPVAKPTPVTTPVPIPQTPSVQHTPSATQLALGAPYSLICALRLIRKGSTAIGYEALDSSGDSLFDFTLPGGRDFANEHNLNILFN